MMLLEKFKFSVPNNETTMKDKNLKITNSNDTLFDVMKDYVIDLTTENTIDINLDVVIKNREIQDKLV